MANIQSQKKRNKQSAKRAERNKAARSELKTRVKAVDRVASADEAADAVVVAQQRLDKAANKGIIHKNQAARRKSRLMRRAAASA